MNFQHTHNLLFIRNLDSHNTLEYFLVSGVASVLLIRFFLKITDYPSLGNNHLHIAHMLFGGIFMAAALFFLLAFLGQSVRRFSSVIGGIGFGMFIDEVGKFLTRDNNYFFHPAISIIYITFIILYLLIHYFDRYKSVSEREYLVNALELSGELALNDLDFEEKSRLTAYLEKSGSHPLAKLLLNYLNNFTEIKNPSPGYFSKLIKSISGLYGKIVSLKYFPDLVLGGFIVYTIVQFINLPVLVFILKKYQPSFAGFMQLYFFVLSGIMVIYGLLNIRRSRLFAYHYFKYAVLISIFFIQFFTFYESQLSAVRGLIINLFVWTVINYLIKTEENGGHEISHL